ncbi:MAG: hypothetical protein ABI986_11120 [Chloroflexota bacterium]
MATPIPVSTLDDNAIQTFIAQTASVAALRTASVPTLTATATLRNTSTPVPTYTLVGTLIPPTPLPISHTNYYRVKHDTQLAKYNYKSRTAGPGWPENYGAQTPEVVRLSVELDTGSGTNRTSLNGTWGQYIDLLNNYNVRKLIFLKSNSTALFNGAGFPQLESLTMGGNVITLDEIQGGWGRVHTFDYRSPGSLKTLNYKNKPDLIHKFILVGWSRKSKASYFSNPPRGDIYWPLVSDRAVWIPLEYLESFPILPSIIVTKEKQPVREQPARESRLISTDIVAGESVTIIGYYPSGSDVWGQISNGGWIELLTHRKGALVYPTSWSMETLPPIPPAVDPPTLSTSTPTTTP